MKIKGFDKDLKCRGFQFEIGKVYDTGAEDKDIKLCSDTVFHYCDSLQNVHKYYSALPSENNRFCEIEVLGAEVSDNEKCGSNKIKIVCEIVGEELDIMRGLVNGNTGVFNTGDHNTGNRNTGNCNTGDRNTGNHNTGNWNTGNRNTGHCNTGDHNTGYHNTGHCNTSHWNTGDRNTGNRNTGYHNTGHCNTGNWNTGMFNSCDYSPGFFCTEEPKARVFDVEINMTTSEFYRSEHYRLLTRHPFMLTEWIEYTEEEKKSDKDKEFIGGYLKSYTFKEACANWWAQYTDNEKKKFLKIPNFDREKFKFITGIEV